MVLSVEGRERGAKVEETKAGKEEGGRLDEEESGTTVSVVKGDVFEESVSLAEGVLSGGDAGCAWGGENSALADEEDCGTCVRGDVWASVLLNEFM